MAADWESEMQDRFDKFQAAMTNEFRTQFAAMGTQLEERLEKRLGERLEQRFDERLTQRLDVQVEQLRDIVRTAADNYGGVLSGLRRDVAEFRNEWRQKAEDTDKVLANHGGRIAAIEKTLSGRRRPRA